MRVYTIILYCTCSMSQRCKKTRVTSLRRPFSRRNICPKFKMTGVSERVRPQLYFDTNFVTVSQKLAELYSSAYFYALLFAVQIPPNHVFIMRVYTIILYCTCSMSQRCKKTRVASLRRPFSRRNICPKFKMTGVSERVRRQLYFDTNFVTVSQKLAELYSSAYFDALLFAVEIPPNHVFIMRVYTILLYCTWSVSQRYKKTRVTSLRRPFSRRNICPKF